MQKYSDNFDLRYEEVRHRHKTWRVYCKWDGTLIRDICFHCSEHAPLSAKLSLEMYILRWIAFNMDKEMRRIANEENEKENRARTMKALESTFPDAIASEFEEIILKKEK